MQNPFTTRGMLTDPEQFIGRKRELAHLLSRINTLQSCSIVGERRIGKSSLLYHIYQTANQRLNKPSLQFLYLDLSAAPAQSQFDLLSQLLHKLGLEASSLHAEAPKAQNLNVLTEQLQRLTTQAGCAVLCLDEFEGLFQYPDEFNDGFFNHLRSLVNQRQVVILTATRRSLQEYAAEEKLTSPFFNLLSRQDLGDFPAEEKQAFIDHYQPLVNFTEDELYLLQQYAKPHPLKLMIFCDVLLESRGLQRSRIDTLKAIEASYENFFGKPYRVKKGWHWVKGWFTGEFVGRWLDNVGKARGLFK